MRRRLYLIGGRKLQEDGVSNRIQAEGLALVAIGALLGVKILRRNAEHVVTLNANTMKNRLPWRRSIRVSGREFGGCAGSVAMSKF